HGIDSAVRAADLFHRGRRAQAAGGDRRRNSQARADLARAAHRREAAGGSKTHGVGAERAAGAPAPGDRDEKAIHRRYGTRAALEPLAEAQAIEMRLGRVEPARANGQEQALHTLATNLVDNAIRYTLAGGRVVVEIWSDEGGAVLEVKDTGPGIPAEERQRVF